MYSIRVSVLPETHYLLLSSTSRYQVGGHCARIEFHTKVTDAHVLDLNQQIGNRQATQTFGSLLKHGFD